MENPIMLEALQSSRFLFILPEKGQKTAQPQYLILADFVSKVGLEVYMIDVNWNKHNSLLECTLEATQKVHELVDELHPTECYFFGFGIGAMLAAQVGFLFRANGMLLCSMPPLFNEELSQLSWLKRSAGNRRIYGGRNRPAYPHKKIKVKTVFLQAERERKGLEKIQAIRTAAFLNAEMVYIPKTGASLTRKLYMEAAKVELEKMLNHK